MKKNITRENVNSFESNVEDVVAYLTGLLNSGEEPTVFETFAMGWLSTISPRFEKLFNEAKITHTQRHTFPAEFSAEMEKYEALVKSKGEESEEARNQFMKAMLLAPDWFNEMARDIANEMGLIPKEVYCLEDGTRVFTPEQVAEHLGVPVDEVINQVEKLRTIQAEQGKIVAESFAVDPSDLHKVH
ncbi:TPA: hypothetical protein NU719_003532 [Acinetobacter baumannii]|uniref:hypothetical protein n=1 Tax=Acinetobacter baumannii TaxID=470 RepID=UPI000D01636F|nr:hypothetical protein [Acinetobacter baumannii]PRO33704.1 hypothetical protein B9W69_15715 [Acinetobacter baumannii]HCJ6519572.1 hypothetical protein [Acinetobacter baumannii]HDL2224893.1 hypothetical protein [Acinetobacter baumannii]